MVQLSEFSCLYLHQENFAGFFTDGIPTYYLQIVVGLYVVQIIYILTILTNGIENGDDKLAERYSLGQNLIKSTVLYAGVATAIILIFNILAGRIMEFSQFV